MHDSESMDHKNVPPSLLELVLRVQGDLRGAFAPVGVTPLQAGLLCYLCQHPDARLVDAAAALRVKAPTLMEVVQDLVRKRWMTNRRSTEDRRSVCLRLSPKGESIARKVSLLVRHVEKTLSEQDRGVLGMTTGDRRT